MNPILERLRHCFLPVSPFLVSPLFGLVFWTAAAQTPPGQPRTSGVDPALQGERDWVDDRWSKTDIGQFLASNLSINGKRPAKPLSIKVGPANEGAVCYDTLDCSLRAGWTGGFLKFNPGRYGLVESPKIAGDLAFALPTGPAWGGATVRYQGLHLHGNRVTLEYKVDGTRVFESPWLEKAGPVAAFSRTLEFGPRQRDLAFVAAAGDGDAVIELGGTQTRAVVRTDGKATGIVLLGDGVRLANIDGKLVVAIAAGDETRRCKLLIWTTSDGSLNGFGAFADAATGPEPMAPLIEPGPARWLPELNTAGQRGFDSEILAVDTLAVPYDNPWKALMFLAGVDFTPDGAAYVCSIHGDVWRVTGIDDNLHELRWKRFATGLFQPLGLKVRNGEVFVLGRDQITRLRDTNGDGEADFYENFCNLIDTLPDGHEYVTSLEVDNAGRFYFCDPKGAHRVAAHGLSQDTLATGFRNPNGLGVSPDGKVLTVSPQQGNWTPSSVICEVKPGGYYGYGGPKVAPGRPLGYDQPLCWIPHSVDNSSSSQVWVPKDHWGALANHMVHLRWGGCGLMLALRDVVDGTPQGAVTLLPGRFLSGPHRGSFNPVDGNLYIAGSAGWQTSAVKDGCLQRVRLTGKPVFLPISWHARANGIEMSFSQKLDPATVADPGSYSVHQWNYRYAAEYGSKDWSVEHPNTEGRDEVAVKSARLLPDGQSVFVELPGLRPVMQMEIEYNLTASGGQSSRNKVWLTLNALDTAKN
jgi:hypothetical protein